MWIGGGCFVCVWCKVDILVVCYCCIDDFDGCDSVVVFGGVVVVFVFLVVLCGDFWWGWGGVCY